MQDFFIISCPSLLLTRLSLCALSSLCNLQLKYIAIEGLVRDKGKKTPMAKTSHAEFNYGLSYFCKYHIVWFHCSCSQRRIQCLLQIYHGIKLCLFCRFGDCLDKKLAICSHRNSTELREQTSDVTAWTSVNTENRNERAAVTSNHVLWASLMSLC